MGSRRRDRSPSGSHLLGVIDRAKQSLDTVQNEFPILERQEFMMLLAAAVAHEVRNVLSPMRAYAELALANPGDQNLVATALAAALMGADRAGLVADAIIDAAKGGSDGPSSYVVVAVKRAIEVAAPDPRFHVKHTIDPGLTAPIGQAALEHVILNLLLNARAAMGGVGGVVVSGRRACGRIAIAVEDGGAGIPAQRLEGIFAPFVSGGGGKGLGLTICKYLVEAAGGSISVQSEPGSGTCFNIYFPDVTEERAAA